MSDLRKEARGRDCMIRSPVCSCDREQTVLAHLRMVGISGAGHSAMSAGKGSHAAWVAARVGI